MSETSIVVDKIFISKVKEKKLPKKVDSEVFNEINPKRERKVIK